jgi:hypothetical protein
MLRTEKPTTPWSLVRWTDLNVGSPTERLDWIARDGSLRAYSSTFDGLGFESWIDEHSVAKPLVALDVLSYGYAFLKEQSQPVPRIGRSLSVGLSDIRTRYERDRAELSGQDMLEANIFKISTWKYIEEWIRKVRPEEPFFDLIVSSGLAATQQLTNDGRLHRALLHQGYRLLKDGGAMFCDVPLVYRATGSEERTLLNDALSGLSPVHALNKNAFAAFKPLNKETLSSRSSRD